MSTSLLGVLLAVGLAADAPTAPPATAAQEFVTRKGPKLYLNGREYRAIGVNLPHLHQAYMGTWFHTRQIYGTPEKAQQAIVTAVEDAGKSGLAFIRFFAAPGYPRDQAMLYDKDPARYWALMDEVFALCRRNGVRLVPSLGTIPGPYLHYGERGQSILDPESRTSRFVHQYVREFVTRYKDDPTVLMWELVNEGTLRADVSQEGRPMLPKGVYPEGAVVREKGVLEDSITWSMFQRLYREQTAFIKEIDPNHLVTSGDSQVRPECTSRRETFPKFRFRPDTWREWLSNNLAAQPEPLDVFSFHHYGNYEPSKPGTPWAGFTSLEKLEHIARVVRAADAPMFIGELGTGPENRADPEAKWLRECIGMLEREEVSLAALWVWHFPWQPEFTIESKTFPELVRRAAEFNRRYAGRE